MCHKSRNILLFARTEQPVNSKERQGRGWLPRECGCKRVDVIEIPTEVPVMPLANAVLFPHSLLPLHIFERRYRDMLTDSLAGDRMFSVALMKKGIEEAVEIEDLCPVAGVGLDTSVCWKRERHFQSGAAGVGACPPCLPGRRKSRSESQK